MREVTEDYQEIFSVDLQKDKKKAVLLNVIAGVIAVVMIIIAHLFVPITTFFTWENGFGAVMLKYVLVLLAMIVYVVLHEMTHGVVMKCFTPEKVRFGFTGLYAYAGSDAYFKKWPYITIALAPVVVWGIILAVLNLTLGVSWFWFVYFVQIMNISGAAGDLYATCRMLGQPSDVLVQDSGTRFIVYKQNK